MKKKWTKIPFRTMTMDQIVDIMHGIDLRLTDDLDKEEREEWKTRHNECQEEVEKRIFGKNN